MLPPRFYTVFAAMLLLLHCYPSKPQPRDGYIDLFHYPDVVTTGWVDLGKRKLAQGKHTLTLEIAGANAAAVRSYMVGLDCVKLSLAVARGTQKTGER